MHTVPDRALERNAYYPAGTSAAAVSRAADGPLHVSVRSSLSDDCVVPVRLLETSTAVRGVPGSDDCFAVLLNGKVVGMAVWDAHARTFHAVDSSNDRLPGSFGSSRPAGRPPFVPARLFLKH
jgi:hypothetical protein